MIGYNLKYIIYLRCFLVDASRFVRSSEIAKFLPSEKFMQETAPRHTTTWKSMKTSLYVISQMRKHIHTRDLKSTPVAP